MKKFIFVITVILLLGFNSKKPNINGEKVVKKELRPFFDSDEINHYYIDFKSDFEHLSKDNDLQVEKKKEFSSFFYWYYPNTVEKDFENLLLKYDYKKSKLSSKQQSQIQDVFSEKDSIQTNEFACIPEYRDIFIFKKKKKTIGIAKICFKCYRFQIIGSEIDTQYFGLWSELDKLRNIVRPNEKKT
ncbi:hypothetical protein [Flavobacterium sp. HJSW_4]|uniref:hypothetical protein n=1 Tax=Flavobacterium sp. HJSW_4 TaxID=3344660 RepID=UPI0036D30FD8